MATFVRAMDFVAIINLSLIPSSAYPRYSSLTVYPLAKKLYTNCTAAVLRAKACVMKTASAIQENAEDIYAEAQQINEDRAAAEEVVEDTADEAAEETEETTDFKEETEETEEGSEE